MVRLFWFLLIALTLASCSVNSSADDTPVDTVKSPGRNQQENDPISNGLLADTLQVKLWLIDVIESYTNSDSLNTAFEKMLNTLTDNYQSYKFDAMYLDSDREPPMSKEEFEKKWGCKYNTEYVGFGGFIISSQDNGKIKVTSCNLLRSEERNASSYRVVVEDLDYKIKFNRDIKVINQNGRLLIDDIIEYD